MPSYIYILVGLAAAFLYRSRLSLLPEAECVAHFSGKSVLITGSSSGIGEATAYELAKCHANLILVARRLPKLEAIREKCLKLGSSTVHVFSYDFSNMKDLPDLINSITRAAPTLHHVILNHAKIIYGTITSQPDQISPDNLISMFKVNVASIAHLALELQPRLENTAGSIFITSTGLAEFPLRNMFAYSTTKHSLNGFTYNLQQELIYQGSNVSVTLGNLGVIRTPDVNTLLDTGMDIPGVFVGEVVECARFMVTSLVAKPRTMNYPVVFAHLQRFMWNYVPYFHEISNLYGQSDSKINN